LIAVGAIVGPTAAGKSDLAVDVAERLNAEIVSVDSMQIYRGMDVGTAKPGPHLTARIKHHLIDEVEASHPLTVAEYQQLGRTAIDRIAEAGRLPLLVGGSGLYFRAIVDDLWFPPHAPEVRARLEEEVERVGAHRLHARLAELDPDAAASIAPSNGRRTVRALEVIEITGRPFSATARAWRSYESRYRLAVAGVNRERRILFERIAERVNRMLNAGLVEEARLLSAQGLSRSARQALGYRQIIEAPEGSTTEQIGREIVRATKRFARRQESWFRADPRVEWFDAGSPSVVEEVAAHLAATLDLTPRRAPS
jgi:tRNA dimethylallyltransferase